MNDEEIKTLRNLSQQQRDGLWEQSRAILENFDFDLEKIRKKVNDKILLDFIEREAEFEEAFSPKARYSRKENITK